MCNHHVHGQSFRMVCLKVKSWSKINVTRTYKLTHFWNCHTWWVSLSDLICSWSHSPNCDARVKSGFMQLHFKQRPSNCHNIVSIVYNTCTFNSIWDKHTHIYIYIYEHSEVTTSISTCFNAKHDDRISPATISLAFCKKLVSSSSAATKESNGSSLCEAQIWNARIPLPTWEWQ